MSITLEDNYQIIIQDHYDIIMMKDSAGHFYHHHGYSMP